MTTLAPYTPETLYQIATSILKVASDALVANGVPLPSNRFVSWNAPAADCCDLLAVHFDRARPGRGNGSALAATVCATALRADYVISIYECVPVSNVGGNAFPPPADLDLSAQMLLRQSWTVYQSVTCASFTQDLQQYLTPPVPCQIVKMGDLVPHGPQGGCANATIDLTLELA